jgi:hypothetical protein
MRESVFETLLMNVIEESDEIDEKKAITVSTFSAEGLLTSNRGLVVRIGDDEFQLTIVKAR